MRRTRIVPALIVLLALAQGGCGGGGDDGPEVLTFFSEPALDGMVFSSGLVFTDGGSPGTGDADAAGNGIAARQFFSFLLDIPDGATIAAAELRIGQVNVIGTPYATHGVVLLEPLDYGTSLDSTDFGIFVAPELTGQMSTNATVQTKTRNVTTLLIRAINAGAQRFQVRLRFDDLDSDADGVSDAARFNDAERSFNGTGQAPVLIVTLGP